MSKLKILVALLFIYVPMAITGQNLEITDIQFRQDSLLVDVFFSVRESGGKSIDLAKVFDDLTAFEKRGNQELEMQKLHFLNLKTSKDSRTEDTPGGRKQDKKIGQMTISVAMDYSGSMNFHDKLPQAKRAIKNLVDLDLPEGSIMFSTFHNKIFPSRVLTKDNYEDLVGRLQPHKNNLQFGTNLYTVLIEKIKELEKLDRSGKKVLILLSDGKHEEAPDGTPFEYVPSVDEIKRLAKTTDIAIYTIAVGTSGIDEELLSALPALTSNPNDAFLRSDIPADLAEILKETVDLATADYKITLRSQFDVYKGLIRTVTLRLNTGKLNVKDDITYSGCSDMSPCSMGKDGAVVMKDDNIAVPLLVGIITIVLLFVGAVVIYPSFARKSFYKKHAHIHRPANADETLMCPICHTEIAAGQEVVTKCIHTQHRDCWEHNDTSPHACLMCDAKFENNFSVADFFAQKGQTAKLNWMVFGGLAMFFAYIVIEIIGGNSKSYSEFINGLLENIYKTSVAENENFIKQNLLAKFYSNTLNGLLFGFSLGMFFSYLEEKRNQMFFKSYLRIFMRASLIGLLGFAVFFAGSALSYSINMDYISQLVIWLMFGLTIGASLSIGTSISLKNGIIGGLLASVIAFQPFYFIIKYAGMPEITRIISFILYGAILGSVIYVVNSMLENYILKIVQTPTGHEKWNNVDVKIHKWMNAGHVVSIGKAVTNHFTMHWESNIPGKAVELQKKNEKVFIYVVEATADKPVLLNNRVLPQGAERQVFNEDIIQIGLTKFKYHEG